MKKLLLISSFVFALTACDKPAEEGKAQVTPTENTENLAKKVEKAYDKGFIEGFRNEFRIGFVKSCAASIPANVKNAQKICECAAERILSNLKPEDMQKLAKEDATVATQLEKESEQALKLCVAEVE